MLESRRSIRRLWFSLQFQSKFLPTVVEPKQGEAIYFELLVKFMCPLGLVKISELFGTKLITFTHFLRFYYLFLPISHWKSCLVACRIIHYHDLIDNHPYSRQSGRMCTCVGDDHGKVNIHDKAVCQWL